MSQPDRDMSVTEMSVQAVNAVDIPLPPARKPVPTSGFIDIHCHFIPGVDDGCKTLNETIEAIRRMKAAGFSGSVCTPHVGCGSFPENVPANIREWVADLQLHVNVAGLDYQLWAGGELRLSETVIDLLKAEGVPTLADSNCVLADFWAPGWPTYVFDAFDWLLSEGYQPILAHPERIPTGDDFDAGIRRVEAMGVWLQGNVRPYMGNDGARAGVRCRELLAADRYHLLAMDTHGADSIVERVEGLSRLVAETDPDTIRRLLADAPRNLILA